MQGHRNAKEGHHVRYPATPFTYAVIIERSIQHEGDERSRTHPGHGYPAYTEAVKEFKAHRIIVWKRIFDA